MPFCPKCGQQNAENAQFCQSCGTDIRIYQRPAGTTVTRAYAGFWIRVVASIIDWLIISAVTGLFALLTLGVGVVFGFLMPWLYEALLTSSEKQATVGKMAFGLVVTDVEGHRISFARATGRHFAKYISGFILFIGFIMVAFTEKKQGLHDMIASTVVVKQ